MSNGAKYKQWMQSNYENYSNMTELAEGCAMHFDLLSELGNTEEETIMFEIATDFFSEYF